MQPLPKRITAIAAAFGAEQKAVQLYRRSSHFRTLCDDLQEVIELSEAHSKERQDPQVIAEYDRLIADLVGELRNYLQHADEWLSRTSAKKNGTTE